MRISSFEVDCQFNPCFVLAEAACGTARALRFIRVRNVRGTSGNWLRLFAEIDGRRTRQKSVRDLAPGDDARAAAVERDIQQALTVPASLAPKRHTGRLVAFSDSDEERELPFDFEVLDAHIIPTDFVRSRLLPAYLREDDALRSFAAEALAGRPDADPPDALRGLYEALLERQLGYQPPVTTRYPDCQRVSGPDYALRHGGSCADLSLLLASLLWCRGCAPALLLFPGHMAAGCFTGAALPDFDVLEDAGGILRLARAGELALVETTALCDYRQESFAQAGRRILERLEAGDEPCQLINATRLLRSGAVSLLADGPAQMRCPNCGYDRLTAEQFARGEPCPACGEPLPAPEPEASPDEVDAAVENSGVLQYALVNGVATVARLLRPDAERVRVAPVWQGRAVRHIGDHAMERGGMRQVALPEGVSRIGDYAFFGCAALRGVVLPEDLKAVGAGAFCGSGLRRVRVPGGVERVSRLAFSGCEHLEQAELCDGIRYIGERAFADCPRLRSARIPASVVRVGRNAFDPGCELLLASSATVVER